MKLVHIFLLIYPVLSLCSCKSQQWPYDNVQGDTKLQTLFVVDLQTGFNGEKVTLWIDGENMIDTLTATTVPEASFTGIKVSIYKGVGNLLPEFIHKFDNNSSDVSNSPVQIDSEVIIRLRVQTTNREILDELIHVKLIKGRYVGLSLDRSGESFLVRQSQEPFIYL